MSNLNFYPYDFTFKITTFHNDFVVKDATGTTKAFVKQKLFKLKEHVKVFKDESENEIEFEIKGDKWLDFNTAYSFLKPDGTSFGRVVRKGWKSLWKAHYEIYDEKDQQDLLIHEVNVWTKVFDSLLGEIPILGMFTGYFFNPAYSVKRPDGTLVCMFSKNKSFFGRRFKLEKINEFEEGEENRILLGIMMMVMLERARG